MENVIFSLIGSLESGRVGGSLTECLPTAFDLQVLEDWRNLVRPDLAVPHGRRVVSCNGIQFFVVCG